jgi:hypothetical protein
MRRQQKTAFLRGGFPRVEHSPIKNQNKINRSEIQQDESANQQERLGLQQNYVSVYYLRPRANLLNNRVLILVKKNHTRRQKETSRQGARRICVKKPRLLVEFWHYAS